MQVMNEIDVMTNDKPRFEFKFFGAVGDDGGRMKREVYYDYG